MVEGEHGPALRALYIEKTARMRGHALERDEPLDRRQQACHARDDVRALYSCFYQGGRKMCDPVGAWAPERARVSDDAGQFRELWVGGVDPHGKFRQALACKIGINAVALYCRILI